MSAPSLSLPPPLAVPGLTRTENHVYSWADSSGVRSPIPSVTTIIRLIDKSGPLMGWARRTVAEIAVRNIDAISVMRKEGGDASAVDWLKGLPGYQRDRAADRGTSVHQIVEQIIRGQKPDIPEEIAAHVAAYHAFVKEWEPRYVAVEQMVCSLRHDYAGTFDAVALIGNERWLIDWKTSSGIYSETALQLAAYGAAEFIGRPGDPRKYRVPRVSRFGVIHITPAGAELVPYAVTRDTFRVFLRAREVWAWTQNEAKTVIGAPLKREKVG